MYLNFKQKLYIAPHIHQPNFYGEAKLFIMFRILYNNLNILNYSSFNFTHLITLYAVTNRHFLSNNTPLFPSQSIAVVPDSDP